MVFAFKEKKIWPKEFTNFGIEREVVFFVKGSEHDAYVYIRSMPAGGQTGAIHY